MSSDDQLKRSCDEDDFELKSQPPAKRMYKGEGPHVEVRFLIPSKIAGIIIGKSGQNIKRLRQTYSAKVNIPDSNGPERILLIEGELGTVEDIMADLLPSILLESSNKRGAGDSAVDSKGGNYTHACDGNNFDLRMLVHQSQAGCVIGRAGFKIKELRQESGLSNVRVYGGCCPGSTDRVIQLVGMPDKLVNTLHNILELVENAPPKGQRTNYDARNFDEYNVDSYGGWMSPNAQRTMSGGGGGGGMFGGHRGGHDGGMSSGLQRGMFSDAGGRMGRDSMMVRGRRDGASHSMYDDGDQGGGSFMGGGYEMSGRHDFGGEVITTQVSIPDNLTGSIMGRGGSRIKQIRAESGAAIKIDKGEPGSSDRIITITGTQEQIQNSQYLLQMCVKKYSGQY